MKDCEVAITYMDITGRKLSEDALRECEARFPFIFSQSRFGIERYGQKGVLIGVNSACLDLNGVISMQEIQGFVLCDA